MFKLRISFMSAAVITSSTSYRTISDRMYGACILFDAMRWRAVCGYRLDGSNTTDGDGYPPGLKVGDTVKYHGSHDLQITRQSCL